MHSPQKYRATGGTYGKYHKNENSGVFIFQMSGFSDDPIYAELPVLPPYETFLCLADDGEEWEGVSVTVTSAKRLPTGEELRRIKNQFWDNKDTIVQFHNDNLPLNKGFAYLWRKKDGFPTPF
ncbi:hypothetical protein ACFSC6_12080 [Rufibacter sediminis]|uniref:DUF7694 domain-containing protein n=1 Tax=Rufibacter sediminis TaxID=2762756 RepID=A0ABR6VTV0_9BACT|nr:hypothetical protein [Rufibacter sediminis]MBC3540620.1 hypothetical protein [Rufibacter sediminis]